MLFFSFSKLLSEASFIYLVFSWICKIIEIIKKSVKKISKHAILIWVIALILSLPHIPRVFSYGTTQIGSYYEKAEYTERYYVCMSRSPSSKADRKEYYLPATIHRARNYYIEKLYFPNGGYLFFSSDNVVIPEEEVELTDYHEDTYYITLTKNICEK